MHDVNPLGPMMHLQELDRRSGLRLRSVRRTKQTALNFSASKSLIIAFLQRFYVFRFLWRPARDVSP
jgi:hypothetical protein